MRMTEARMDFSIVTTMKAVGFPKRGVSRARPFALFSKRRDRETEARRAASEGEASSNLPLGGVLFALILALAGSLPLQGQPSPVVPHTDASPQAPERGHTFERKGSSASPRRPFQPRIIAAIPSLPPNATDSAPPKLPAHSDCGFYSTLRVTCAEPPLPNTLPRAGVGEPRPLAANPRR